MKTSGETVRIGMIGCGAIAEIYHLPALVKIPGVAGNIVLADSNSARLSAMRDKFNVADGVGDYRELAGRVDGVIVATPPTSHFEICKWFLERGIHVLCEKPLTESISEAEELVRIAEQNGAQLAVNQTLRFFPTHRKVRELIAAGVLGDLESITFHDGVEFNWPAASPFHFKVGAKGAWSDTGVHLLDTVCYWLNVTPELVDSRNDSRGGPEAIATVRLQHQNCDIEIKVSRLARLKNRFEIVGSLGSIECDASEFAEVRVKSRRGAVTVYKCGSRKTQYTDFAKPLLENFVAVVAGREQPVVSGASTLGTIRILEEAYLKQRPFEMPWDDVPSGFLSAVDGDQRPMRVLVTGASGFVGGRIVEMMLQSGVAEPVAALRGWSRAARVARFPVSLAICDICDPAQVDAAVKGIDAIVHCAKTDDRESIVGGTRNLLEAAVKHGVQKFVFLSTAEVYGPDVHEEISEEQPTPMTGRAYGDAKVEAEQVCREFHSRGLKPTILRPSLIYGPYSGSWTVNIAKRLQSGNWGLFDKHGEGKANLIHVDDLVQAIVLSLSEPAAPGEAFNVNGPETITWNEYFARFNAALGQQPLKQISAAKSRLRTKVMDAFGLVANKILERHKDRLMKIYLQGGWPARVMKRIKGELQTTPSGNELNDLFARDVVYSDKKARDLIGYEPCVDLDLGLELSVAWLQHHELAPKQARISQSRTTHGGTTQKQAATLVSGAACD